MPKIQIDFFDVALFVGAPLFLGALAFLFSGSLDAFLIIFGAGIIGMTSLYGHEYRWFWYTGAVTGFCLGGGISFVRNLELGTIIGTAVASGMLGYFLARWGYHLLDHLHFDI